MLDLYFKHFFNNYHEKELFLANSPCDYIYKNIEQSEWFKIEQAYKKLLPYGNLDNFNIEINKNASTIINQLFNEYVDDNTLVVSLSEHTTLMNNIDKIKPENCIKLDYKIIENFNIDLIIQQYKNNNNHSIFVYGAGIIQSKIVSNSFYLALKDRLVKENIKHYIALDDIHGMFIIPRDYSIFDSVIFTCHAILPNYSIGVFLSKQPENFGFRDNVLEQFIGIVKHIVIPKLNKFFLFNFMVEQYLSEELKEQSIFYKPKNAPWHTFCVSIDRDLYEKIVVKYKQELAKYSIGFYDNILTIRLNFILELDYETRMEGFKKLKEVLQKCIKLKDRL